MHIDGEYAANTMDRLSDWVGSFVPGCSRLRTRHPVKVSLVLGGLGLVAGWLTVLALFVLRDLRFGSPLLFTIFPGTILGIFVLVPLMSWQKVSAGRCVLGVLLASAAGWLHMLITAGSPPIVFNFSVAGFLSGLTYAGAGAASSRGKTWWMMLPVPLTSAAAHAVLIISIAPEYRPRWFPSWGEELLEFGCIANLFAVIFASVGITFGAALWDRSPLPKFEPDAELNEPAELQA